MKGSKRKKKLGSYPYIGVVVSITLALFVTGLFGTLVIYSNQFEQLVRKSIRLQVYLKNGLTDMQRMEVEKKLETSDYVSRNSKGADLTFVSREEAARKFVAETGEDFQSILGENPLHEAYLISIDPSFQTKDGIARVKKTIEAMPGVYQVFYVQDLIESVNRNVLRIGAVLIGLALLFLLTVVLLINNTIRLALFSQRFLIRSMQLVGATRGFIQRPFLLRSAGYGALAGIFASAAIFALNDYANRKITDLTALQNERTQLILFGGLLVVGILVAVISTYFSIRKYLRMSLDELY